MLSGTTLKFLVVPKEGRVGGFENKPDYDVISLHVMGVLDVCKLRVLVKHILLLK